ncbi:MAG: ArnT family glycosyltransferase [Phycisphaerae bacterium]
MTLPSFHTADASLRERPVSPGRTLLDLLILYLLLGVIVAMIAHGPNHTFRFAQLFQINAAIDINHGGDWLLPRYHTGNLFHKPPVYAWLLAGVFQLTGAHDDVIFRIPAILATAVTLTLVYLLGRRWMGRRGGLIAGVLWLAGLHMSKMPYLALTDPLLTAWITGSVFTLDRILFHPAPRDTRWKWVLAFWITIIGGAVTKGWGVANIPMIALLGFLAVTLGPGFRLLRKVRGISKLTLAVRLVVRRLWSSAKLVKLHWGLLATAAVLGPYMWIMWTYGGEEMQDLLRFEVWQRITGTGEHPPHGASLPVPIYLLYYDLPTSALAIAALLLVRPLRWFSRRSQTALPLCWILAFLIPYSLSHGFRPDYLYPCYAAIALLATAGIEQMIRRSTALSRPAGRVAYEVFRAMPTVLALVVLLGCLRYLTPQLLTPEAISKNLPMPWFVAQETWILLGLFATIAAVVAGLGVWASLTFKPRLLVALIAIAMLGAQFLHTHMVSPHARSGDGVKMRDFALAVREQVDRDDPLHFFRTEKLTTECYLGRFGTYYSVHQEYDDPTIPQHLSEAAQRIKRKLENRAGQWFITTDRGLVELGAAQRDPDGKYKLTKTDRFITLPAQLGEVVLQSHHIRSQNWGTAYLIRLKDNIRTTGTPYGVGYVRYRPKDEW